MIFKNLFAFAGFSLGMTCLLLSFFIFFYGKTKLHRIWGFFNLSVAIWGYGAFLIGNAVTYGQALYYWRIAHIGGIFIPVFFFHTISIFCNKEKFLKKAIIFVYAQGFLFLFLNTTNYFISNLRFVFNSFYYNQASGFFYPIFFLIWISLVVWGHCELISCYKYAPSFNKNQILYFLLGMLVGFLGGSSNFFPMFNIDIYPFGNFTIPLYCIIATYAILKYRLMDIKVAITRTTIFIVVYTLVLGLPFVSVFYWKEKFIILLGINWWIIPLVMSTILATVGPFVYIYIDKKAEDRLLREQRNYQNILRNASKGMIMIKNLKHLLNLIVHVVMKAVKLKNVSIYLLDGENSRYELEAERGLEVDLKEINGIDSGSVLVTCFKSKGEPIVTEEVMMKLREDEKNVDLKDLVSQLNSLNAALAIPCFLEERLIGILILGEKRSKKLYSEDDLAVFSVLANQAALAIENAQFYNEIQRTNEQLIQAEKLATIGTMADGLSHQINNRFHALSLISGDSLDILQTSDFSGCDEKIKEVIKDVKIALEKIQNNVLQGGEVVKGLLKYSLPDEGGFEPVCLIEVISGAIEMVQYKIKLKEINLVQNIPIGLPKLLGSRIQLQEVFFNLIDNAYDAIKERQMILKEYGYKGKIDISAVCLDGHVEIVIVDNGIGVKEQDRKKLFAPFFTTKASSRKGTGLGLYVIEKIVTAHQGKLSVDSNYGVGTHFIMMLPRAKG